MYTYKAARHYAPVEEEYTSLEEALERARIDHDSGDAYPVLIRDDAGTLLLDHVQILDAVDSRRGGKLSA